MARLVLTDASPLLGLARIDGIGWLRSLFGKVEVPLQVLLELEAGDQLEEAIQAAFRQGWLVVRDTSHEDGPHPPHLGVGEWSTIQAALGHKGPCLILLDDRLARREARSLGLSIAGTAAVIGMARSHGLISSARDAFATLLRTDFRISAEVIRTVLAQVEPEDPSDPGSR